MNATVLVAAAASLLVLLSLALHRSPHHLWLRAWARSYVHVVTYSLALAAAAPLVPFFYTVRDAALYFVGEIKYYTATFREDDEELFRRVRPDDERHSSMFPPAATDILINGCWDGPPEDSDAHRVLPETARPCGCAPHGLHACDDKENLEPDFLDNYINSLRAPTTTTPPPQHIAIPQAPARRRRNRNRNPFATVNDLASIVSTPGLDSKRGVMSQSDLFVIRNRLDMLPYVGPRLDVHGFDIGWGSARFCICCAGASVYVTYDHPYCAYCLDLSWKLRWPKYCIACGRFKDISEAAPSCSACAHVTKAAHTPETPSDSGWGTAGWDDTPDVTWPDCGKTPDNTQ